MSEDKKSQTVPYLPFRTFLGALDQLKAHGMPNKIDRSVFPSQSGVMQGQIVAALAYFDLIDEHGKTSLALEDLALKENDRKKNLKPILVSHYSDLVKLDLTKVSPSQLDQKFDEYGVTGDTKKKAKTFFTKAAQFIDLPLSSLLTRKTRTSSGARKKRNTSAKTIQDTPEDNGNDKSSALDAGMRKTITLRSGGELTLLLSVNLFDLKGEERKFVFGLIDQIQGYEEPDALPLD